VKLYDLMYSRILSKNLLSFYPIRDIKINLEDPKMEIRNDILTMRNLYSRMTPFDLFREIGKDAEKTWIVSKGNLKQYYEKLSDEDKSKFNIFTSSYAGGNLQSLLNTYNTLEHICERIRAIRPPTLMFILQKGPNPVSNIIEGSDEQIESVSNWIASAYTPTDLQKISLGFVSPDKEISNIMNGCSSISLTDFVGGGKPVIQPKKENSKIRSMEQLQKILSRK